MPGIHRAFGCRSQPQSSSRHAASADGAPLRATDRQPAVTVIALAVAVTVIGAHACPRMCTHGKPCTALRLRLQCTALAWSCQ